MSKFFGIITIVILLLACNRTEYTPTVAHAPFLNSDTDWADSLLLTLSLEEKIGQLLFLKTDVPDTKRQRQLNQDIRMGKITGLQLSGLPLADYANFIDSAQTSVKIPLLTATDQLVSPNQMFSDQTPYPFPVTLATLQDEKMDQTLLDNYLLKARALKLDMIFGPELNTQHLSDTIFNFQQGAYPPTLLAKQTVRMVDQFQNEGILTVANNFQDLVYIENDTLRTLPRLLEKYTRLVNRGLSGMLINEALFKDLNQEKRPKGYLKQYLSENVNFDGLMLGAARDTQMLRALVYGGVDMLVVRDSVDLYFQSLRRMVEEGLLSERELNERVYKVLMAKAWRKNPMEPELIEADQVKEMFDSKMEKTQVEDWYRQSIVVARNPESLLPLSIAQRATGLVQVGQKRYIDFEKISKKYLEVVPVLIKREPGKALATLTKKMRKSPVIISLDQVVLDTLKDADFIASVNRHAERAATVIVNYGNPLQLPLFDKRIALIQSFENNAIVRQEIAQMIFGGATSSAKLPLALSPELKYGEGAVLKMNRLAYVTPHEVGIDPVKLVGIDALVKSAIQKKVTPGAQVMLIKNGKVFYHKAFGYHEYNKAIKVAETDLYDIASLTKVTATTLAAMKLYEQGKFPIKSTLSKYMTIKDNKKLEKITLKKLLTHSSGIQSNMPISRYVFLKDTLDPTCNEYFCNQPNFKNNVKIADNFYMDQRWQDTLWQTVLEIIPKKRKKRYHYSDVNFNLLQAVIEKQSGKSLDKYLDQNFYKPLGLRYLTYLPREKFKLRQLVPTSLDDRWRKQKVHGYVHDESAALLGGVAGNAGQFSNVQDLGVLFQMLLNKGSYGGRQYLKPKTVDLFTQAQYRTHRGLGFDTRDGRRPPSCSTKASAKTYGHTGFTGTCVWVDPKEELIFIFLSNRIAPSPKNKKLFKTKLRSRIHNIVYEAIGTYKPISASLASESSEVLLPIKTLLVKSSSTTEPEEDCEEDIMASRK